MPNRTQGIGEKARSNVGVRERIGLRLRRGAILIASCIAATLPCSASGQSTPRTFNDFIIAAVESIDTERDGGGYDIQKAFTQDLQYGGAGVVPASNHAPEVLPPYPTMCVAAVAETIVEAMNLYAAQEPTDRSAFVSVPLSTWRSCNLASLRANIFRYEGTGSAGTAFALRRAGIGREKPFTDLRRGDFVNFSRSTHTGHAVIFWSYLTSEGETPNHSDAVIGFRYFSAQGQGRVDGGFGYRNGYFVNHCPTPRVSGRDDCNILRGLHDENGQLVQNQRVLNTGEMFHPTEWTSQRIAEAQRALTRSVSRGFESQGMRGAQLRAAIAQMLEKSLEARPQLYVDGTESE